MRTITRYPVKSMAGEYLGAVELDARGLVGDRVLAVRTADGRLGSGKDSRRFRRVAGLRHARAVLGADGRVSIELPDGTSVIGDGAGADAALTAWLGQPVELVTEGAVSHFDEDGLHLLTTASLRAVADRTGVVVDVRRARANVVLDAPRAGFVEDDWLGAHFRVGTAVVAVSIPMPRCDMVNQTGLDLPDGRGTLRGIGDAHAGELGVVASVVTPGRLSVGDPLVRIT